MGHLPAINWPLFPKGIPTAICAGSEKDMEPKVSHLYPIGRRNKFPGGWSGTIREFVGERDRNQTCMSRKKLLQTWSSHYALPLRTYRAGERRVVPSLSVRHHGYRDGNRAFCQMRVQIGYEKSLNCIRECFYMYAFIMDCGLWIMCSNSLHFQALHRADSGLCRHTTARLKTVWKVFMPQLLLQTRWVFVIISQVIQHQHWTLQVLYWAALPPAQRAMVPTTPALLAQAFLQLMLVSLLLPPRFCQCWITTITWLIFWPQRRQPCTLVLKPAA